MAPRYGGGDHIDHPTTPQWITRAGVAKLWDVNTRTIVRLENEGKLTAYRFGRAVRYRLDQVLSWAESQAR